MSDYDSNKSSTFITYLDKNNMYGWPMSVFLTLHPNLILENQNNDKDLIYKID